MRSKLTKKSANATSPIGKKQWSEEQINEFKIHILNEVHAQIMAVIFLGSAFTVVSYFNITLITVLEASRWFALIGCCGFLLSFLVRRKWRLSLMDGLLYNAFGTAPLGLALFLVFNAQCSETYTEVYRIVERQPGGSGYTLQLENDALSEYWHIRNLDRDKASTRYGKIEYTFCHGLLGYRVVEQSSMTH